MIWATAVIISGHKRSKEMGEIQEAIYKLEEKGRMLAAQSIRTSAKKLFLDFTKWEDEAKLW